MNFRKQVHFIGKFCIFSTSKLEVSISVYSFLFSLLLFFQQDRRIIKLRVRLVLEIPLLSFFLVRLDM